MHFRRSPMGSVIAVALVSILSISSKVCAADDDLEATLQARYAAMKAAMAAHDGKALASILAPDFTSIDISGQSEDGAQMIAEVDGLKPDPNKVSTTTLTSLSLTGTSVTVEQRYDMKTTKTFADGVTHNVELVTLSTDTWVMPANEWLIERTVTDQVLYFVDGQEVLHKVRS